MKRTKSIIKLGLLIAGLVGTTYGLSCIEVTNENDYPSVTDVEIIDKEEENKASDTNPNTPPSVSDSNEEEIIVTIEDVATKTESNETPQTNQTDSKKTNNKTETVKPIEEKKPTEQKESSNVSVQQEPKKEVSKPTEPKQEAPKKGTTVKEEVKKEEIVIEAYLSHETLNYINQERSKLGLSPLSWDSSLENAILTRAKETNENYSHTRPNGTKWTTVLSNKDAMQLYGEIITNRFSSYDAVQAWMDSPSHKESMLDSDKTHGVVAVYNDVYVCITVKYFD